MRRLTLKISNLEQAPEKSEKDLKYIEMLQIVREFCIEHEKYLTTSHGTI